MKNLLTRFVLSLLFILLAGYGRGYAHVLPDSDIHYHVTAAQDHARKDNLYGMHYHVLKTVPPASQKAPVLLYNPDNVTEYEYDELVVFEKQLEGINYFTTVFCAPAYPGSCPPAQSSPQHFSNSTSYRYLTFCVIRI